MQETKSLDDKVVEAIKNGWHHFTHISVAVDSACQRDNRQIDKALQRLRRKGVITYTGQKTGWKLVEKQP